MNGFNLVWNSNKKESISSVPVKSEDFKQLIQYLLDYASELSVTKIDGAIRVNPVDTAPGRLAENLVRPLGYDSAQMFLGVNDETAF